MSKFTKEENAAFWEDAHKQSDPYWVTNDSLEHICGLYGVTDIIYGLPKLHVLEIGVGGGAATETLSKMHTVIAVDISQTAIDRVSQFCKGTYLTQDMVNIPSSSIGFGICANTLIHCDDEMTKFIFHEVHRVLHKDGLFICDNSSLINDAHPYEENNSSEKGSHNYRTHESFIKLAKENGLEVVSDSLLQYTRSNEIQKVHYMCFIKMEKL